MNDNFRSCPCGGCTYSGADDCPRCGTAFDDSDEVFATPEIVDSLFKRYCESMPAIYRTCNEDGFREGVRRGFAVGYLQAQKEVEKWFEDNFYLPKK